LKVEVVLFGASQKGTRALPFLKEKYKVVAFSDNDSEKWDNKIEDISIISPKEMLHLVEKKNVLVVITSSYYDEIYSDLHQLGVSNSILDEQKNVDCYFNSVIEAEKLGISIMHSNSKVIISREELKQSIVLSINNINPYLYDTVTNFEYLFNSVLPVTIGEKKIVDFSAPREHMLTKINTSFYFSSIIEGVEPLELYLFKYRPKPGDIVFDCGAYCGVSTYLFSKMVGPSGKVFAFEPDHQNYEMLIKNIQNLNMKNVIPINKGIYSANTEISFYSEGGSSSAAVEYSNQSGRSFLSKINVVTLETAFNELGLNRLDFVKMDIEGAEIEAISGSLTFLREKAINFAIASYHCINGQYTFPKLEELFSIINYKVETGFNPHFTTWAYKNHWMDMTQN